MVGARSGCGHIEALAEWRFCVGEAHSYINSSRLLVGSQSNTSPISVNCGSSISAFGALTTALAGAVAVALVAATASTNINVLKSKVYRSRDFSNPKLINNLLRLSI